MSRFYQRYLSQLKKDDSPSVASSSKMDPTAMTSPSSNKQSSRIVAANKVEAAAPTTINNEKETSGVKSRRVQIFNESDSFCPDDTKQLSVFAKPESSKKFLRNALLGHYLFESLEEKDMQRIVDCMRPTFAEIGETIIKQGDLGDLFYCLEVGTASASVTGLGTVLAYESGGCFGELALIYNSPRAASVIADTACRLWVLDLKTFRYILATTSSAKMLKRCEFLKKCPFLDPLTNEQIGKLAGALEVVEFQSGQHIVRQGDVGDSFYIIEEGTVKCTQIKSSGREVELIKLKDGDYFGEMALMLNETRHANVIATSACHLLALERVKFDMLLGPVQEVLAKKMRIRILQSVPLLAKLPESKLEKLSNVMRVQQFNDGAYIIRQGEEGSRFYIINEGEVRCTRAVSSTEEEELIKLGAQEFFGERALITNEVRKANVIACGHVECLVLERVSFQTLLTEVQDEVTSVMTGREVTLKDEEEETVGPLTNFKFEDLKVMRTVGTGTFGRVKMVQHKQTGQVCALKCMNKSEVLASHQERNIMAEKNLLFECSSSPFVLSLLQTFNHPHQILMLMEFIQGGELWSYIYEKMDTVTRNSAGGFEMSAVKFYAGNVILAFRHLGLKNIAYRDLKPENLLIDSNGYVKVIDFGFAKKFPYTKNGQRQDKTYTLCGTPEYLAPEIVMSKGYDKSVDYWALGCFIYELYLAKTPFQADFTTKIFQNIVASEKNLSFPGKMDPQHVALVKKLLNVNPAFRLGNMSGGVDDIMRDPFFSTMDWDALSKRQIKSPYSPPITSAMDTSNFDDYEEDDDIPPYVGSQDHFNQF